jgi:hypothetical protein
VENGNLIQRDWLKPTLAYRFAFALNFSNWRFQDLGGKRQIPSSLTKAQTLGTRL